MKKTVNEMYDDLLKKRKEHAPKPKTVRELIRFLETCNPDALVHYTLGGGGNTQPITFWEKDSREILDEPNNPKGVLIGKCTW